MPIFVFVFVLWVASLAGAFAQDRGEPLVGGWSEFPPYSYLTNTRGIARWDGFDVELLDAISKRANVIVVADRVAWQDHVAGLQAGEIDIAPHAVLTPDRQAYAVFSIPYRTETMVLVLRKGGEDLAGVSDVEALIDAFKDRRFRLGLEEGVELPNVPMREFVNDPGYDRAIFRMSAFDLVTALLNDEIDGYWADRVEAAYYNDTLGVADQLSQHSVELHGNLHYMFNKETVPWDVVYRFNAAIESVYEDGTYQRLNTKYSFPILVSLSLENFWFRAVDIIGTIAFALSGLLLAHRYGYDVFGALVLASLPAVGGGVVRDLISNRDEIAVFSDPIYVQIILGLVVGGHLAIRVFRKLMPLFGHRDAQPSQTMSFVGAAIQLCDAVGLAAFTVTGVVVALITNSAPLWIWGPILAALTAAGGGILRDITRSDPDIPFLKGEFYPEIAAVWGLFLSVFLLWEARLFEPSHISLGILLTFAGALVTRLAVIRFGWKSPLFSAS